MRIRTADILLAKQTLYQLSYTPFQGGANDKEKRLNCALRYYITQIFLVVFRRGPCGFHNPCKQGLDLLQ
jgi:NADH:ubiquinone oxidoreductase subunit 3 (subunit A)